MTEINVSEMTPRALAKYMVLEYTRAELAILQGAQSYSISGKSLTRASLPEIVKARKEWGRKLAALSGRSPRRVKTVYAG